MISDKLYSCGDAILHGYVIDQGRIAIGIGNRQSPVASCENLMAGTLEYFLYEFASLNRVRLFDLYCDSIASVRRVPFHSLTDIRTQYDFGVWSNGFLALALQLTNQIVLDAYRDLPLEEQTYQVRARLFMRMIDDLSLLAARIGLAEVRSFSEALRNVPLYQEGRRHDTEEHLGKLRLPTRAMERLAEEFPSGSVICREGESADCLYALLRGRIGVFMDDRCIGAITQPGEGFGELALFLSGKRTATLVAESPSAVYRIARRDLAAFHRTHEEVFLNIGVTLAQRVATNVTRVQDLVALQDQKSASAKKARERRGAAKLELRRLIAELERMKERFKKPEITALWEKYAKPVAEAEGSGADRTDDDPSA